MATLLFDSLALVPEWRELIIKHGQRRTDSHVHIQVLVGAQAAAKKNPIVLRLLGGELAIGLQLPEY